MLYSLLQESGAVKAHHAQYVVGNSVPMSTASSEAVSIQPPQGGRIPVKAGEQFTDTEVPGIYTASTSKDSWRFAVNLPPDESKTAPIAVEQLQQLGLPLKAPTGDQARLFEQKKRLQNAELEARQKLWRWLILSALVVLMLETWVAGFVSRRASKPAEVTV